MRLGAGGSLDLTYCTNIHPGNGWDEVFANLRRYAPALKERLAPGAPFGLGLRLSAEESAQLLGANRLRRFRDFLDAHGLYVALINGFVFGAFHGRPVKTEVFAPDWREEGRVHYTLRLVEILRQLLPSGMDGGISTCPLSYRRWVAPDDRVAWEAITLNVVRVAQAMARAAGAEGRQLHLDIEPEPDGLLENTVDVIRWYRDWLLPAAGPALARHVQICFDTCHFAVEHEDPRTALDRLTDAGIRVGRAQISSALEVRSQGDTALAHFADSPYLHQVIAEGDDGRFHRYPDLPDALRAVPDARGRRWRIHFHVPLFVEEYEGLGSTQPYVRSTLELLRQPGFTRHLEIETYTWDVLPPPLKGDLLESIEREYRWVMDQLARAPVKV